jgi:hypothetical protein
VSSKAKYSISRKNGLSRFSLKAESWSTRHIFEKKNPNYTRPSLKESNKGSPSGWDEFDLDEITAMLSTPAKGNRMDPSQVKGDGLLICSPTIPGFSLGNAIWGEHLIPLCW